MTKDQKRLRKTQYILKQVLAKINSLPISADEFLGDDLYEDVQDVLEERREDNEY